MDEVTAVVVLAFGGALLYAGYKLIYEPILNTEKTIENDINGLSTDVVNLPNTVGNAISATVQNTESTIGQTVQGTTKAIGNAANVTIQQVETGIGNATNTTIQTAKLVSPVIEELSLLGL